MPDSGCGGVTAVLRLDIWATVGLALKLAELGLGSILWLAESGLGLESVA